MVGTATAQALPVLVAPVLTRLYGPRDFAALGSFTALTVILSVVSTARYELAVVLPKDREDAAAIMLLSGIIACLSCLGWFVIGLILHERLSAFLRDPFLDDYWWLVPGMVLCTNAYNTLNYWCIREQRFRYLAGNRSARSLLTIIASLAFFRIHLRVSGLVVAATLGTLLATLAMLITMLSTDARLLFSSFGRIAKMMRRYRRFPFLSIPADLTNTLAGQLPVFVFMRYFGADVVGYWNLVTRVLYGPVGIIASAYADVYKQKAAEEYRETGDCRHIWRKTFKIISLISLAIFPLLAILSPLGFAWFFGRQWGIAGRYAQVLTLVYALGFIASPLSGTLYVAERLDIDLFWQVGLLVSIAAALLIGVYVGDPLWSVGCYSIAYGGMYVVNLRISYLAAGQKVMVRRDETP